MGNTNDELRTSEQRKADVLRRLETDRDVWVATASTDGAPHLVPFSLMWDGWEVVAATVAKSVTVDNLRATQQARLALESTRDVVLIDVRVRLAPVADVDPATADLFAARTDWDPRTLTAEWFYLLMEPVRILAWNSESELEGRTIMRDGRWLAD